MTFRFLRTSIWLPHLTLGCLLVASLASAQQVYRWVDKDGRVHYTESPPPAGAARSVERRAVGGGAVANSDLPYATQQAMKNFPVTLYTSAECGAPCDTARRYLEQRGVPFSESKIGDEKGRQALSKLTGNALVPAFAVGRNTESGFEQEAWKKLLDTAGYPASAPPGRRPASAASAKASPVQRQAVVLYTTPTCGTPCNNAKQLLTGRGAPFTEIDASQSDKADELEKLSGETMVPTMVLGGKVLKGFEAATYGTALTAGGYPDTPRP